MNIFQRWRARCEARRDQKQFIAIAYAEANVEYVFGGGAVQLTATALINKLGKRKLIIEGTPNIHARKVLRSKFIPWLYGGPLPNNVVSFKTKEKV